MSDALGGAQFGLGAGAVARRKVDRREFDAEARGMEVDPRTCPELAGKRYVRPVLLGCVHRFF